MFQTNASQTDTKDRITTVGRSSPMRCNGKGCSTAGARYPIHELLLLASLTMLSSLVLAAPSTGDESVQIPFPRPPFSSQTVFANRFHRAYNLLQQESSGEAQVREALTLLQQNIQGRKIGDNEVFYDFIWSLHAAMRLEDWELAERYYLFLTGFEWPQGPLRNGAVLNAVQWLTDAIDKAKASSKPQAKKFLEIASQHPIRQKRDVQMRHTLERSKKNRSEPPPSTK